MVDHADPGRRDATLRLLYDRYWAHRERSGRTPPSPEGIRIVLHVRRGDRSIVELPDRKLILHGNRVYEDEVAYQNEIVRLEPDFRHTQTRHYVNVLREITAALGTAPASLTVLSDGHGRTLFALIDAVARGLVQISRSERHHLRRLATQWRDEMQSLPWQGPVNRIIGESVADTLRSIDALATADLVIHDAGGFSRVVHRLYRHRSDTLILDSRHFNAASRSHLREWIERRRNQAARADSRTAPLTSAPR
ncbi:hypothetical protein [Elongatibacter sediminis]|uniref:Uncharacterized protein n=1 Tax=Elongatibacter sediminis TaxID=3119006 RepID=A0AAW9R4V9_9GAMM